MLQGRDIQCAHFDRLDRYARTLSLTLIFLFLNFSVRVAQATEVDQQGCLIGEVLIKFKTVSAPKVELEKTLEIAEFRKIGGAGWHWLRLKSTIIDEAITQLAARSDVATVECNAALSLESLPDDPLFPEQWALRNEKFPGVDIGAEQAWEITTGSPAIVVAVTDGGIEHDHPDLRNNLWSAPTSFTVMIGDEEITCPKGTHGFNAPTRTCDPNSRNSHGTRMAGIIGAQGNNQEGISGVNWDVGIMDLKIWPGSTATVINGIEFAIQVKEFFSKTGSANVRVLSNSWGISRPSLALEEQIWRAHEHNMLFVASAGNNGWDNDTRPHYPSSYEMPNVIAVTGTDRYDNQWFNYGLRSVHLGAPGVFTLSTDIDGTYNASSGGTSPACAFVAGSAALVLAACDLDTDSLKATLLNNTDEVASLIDRTQTGGRVNVNRAIRACWPGF